MLKEIFGERDKDWTGKMDEYGFLFCCAVDGTLIGRVEQMATDFFLLRRKLDYPLFERSAKAIPCYPFNPSNLCSKNLCDAFNRPFP